jgi:hypothetical protein
MQWACSSTHKASLAMMLSRILNWWMVYFSYGVRLGGAGGVRRPLATMVAGNPRNYFVFLDLIGFYLQIQNNRFIGLSFSFHMCCLL